MSKSFIAILLLAVLTSACNQPVNVTTLPTLTPIANTINPTPSETPTPLFVTATEDLLVTATGSACAAPAPRVQIGEKVLVTVEDWDKLKLRSEAAVSANSIVMELDQYSQLKILEGPVCVYSAETDYSYWFWKVVVIPSGEIGWVAEGDYSHYFIQKY
ncbi:MAG TPA: hypothetical protein VFQ13_15700 [Anaerolineales bacterium]|nr:hypothetical protein [Anaerolineales bacterium]